MKPITYLAGPMRRIKDFNYPAFFETAGLLRALGHTVLNPAENCGPTLARAVAEATVLEGVKTFGDYFRPDLLMLADTDQVCMLPGWRASQGASLEYQIARQMGLPVVRLGVRGVEPLFRVVGVSGYAGSGKDTIAMALVEEKGYIRLSFADVVRDLVYEINPAVWSYDHVYSIQQLVGGFGWDKAKRDHPAVREMLQVTGGGARRILGEDVWVNACLAKMEDGCRYVISDLRYPNEADAVKQLGGQLWRVQREGVGPINDHESETALDDYPMDRHLHNASTVGALRTQALA